MRPEPEDTSKFPALGRALLFLDEPRNVERIVHGLYALCAGLFALDFFYDKHTTFGIEGLPGFYGIYGFVMCSALVIAAKGLRRLIMRPEDYYAPRDSQGEPWAEEQLERRQYDA